MADQQQFIQGIAIQVAAILKTQLDAISRDVNDIKNTLQVTRGDISLITSSSNELAKQVNNLKLSDSSPDGKKKGSNTYTINHAFAFMAKTASSNEIFANKWRYYQEGQFKDRYQTAKGMIDMRKMQNTDLNEIGKYNNAIAAQVFTTLTPGEKDEFKSWKESDPIKPLFIKHEATVDSPANTVGSVGTTTSNFDPTMAAASMAGFKLPV
jgi:hypothetical protein